MKRIKFWSNIREDSPDHWPGGQARRGCEAVGEFMGSPQMYRMAPEDVMVTWTLWKHSGRAKIAAWHQSKGGRVIVMENGWLRYVNGRRYYQVALGGHNGKGTYPIGNHKRWKGWKIPLQPWSPGHDFIMLKTQRGSREWDPDITHGAGWPDEAMGLIRQWSDLPVRVRPHPGNKRPCLPQKDWPNWSPLDVTEAASEVQAKGARSCVLYSSTAAARFLIAGIPVVYGAPFSIVSDMGVPLGDGRAASHIHPEPDRGAGFAKIAWSQWSENEVKRGEAFRWVLEL